MKPKSTKPAETKPAVYVWYDPDTNTPQSISWGYSKGNNHLDAKGHVNAALSVLKELKEKGHRLIFDKNYKGTSMPIDEDIRVKLSDLEN